MDVLADENAETEWIRALIEAGHDVERVLDDPELGLGAPDRDVLRIAARSDRVLLTGDQADFSDPPVGDHAGIVIVADVARTGGEVRRAVGRIERLVTGLSGLVAYVSEWS